MLSLASTRAAGQPQRNSTTLIEPSGLAGWRAVRTDSRCVRNPSGTITVAECAGWLRTDHTIFGDYTVTFEVRAESLDVEGFLGVLGVDNGSRRPEVVIAIPIAGQAATPRRSPVTVEPIVLSAAARAQAINPPGQWNAYTVTRNRTGLHVVLNGTQIASAGPVRASDGWLGFRADTGEFEVRNVQLRRVYPQGHATRGKPGELVDGAYGPGSGVTLPRLLKEAKPQYTSDAMQHLIEGTVLLECIVGIDGHVSDVTVIRSLDSEFGLDAKAVEAARQWRFQPGTRNGEVVPVWITIELAFTLRK